VANSEFSFAVEDSEDIRGKWKVNEVGLEHLVIER
jgi:hypothetical protein